MTRKEREFDRTSLQNNLPEMFLLPWNRLTHSLLPLKSHLVIDLSIKSSILIFCMNELKYFEDRVTNSSESETALFPAKKGQNPPLIFPIFK